MFVHFLEVLNLVGKAAGLRNSKPERLPVSWRDSKNKTDCGIFVMRRMETYMGNGMVGFITDLTEMNMAQMNLIRMRYMYTILKNMENRLVDHVVTASKGQRFVQIAMKLRLREVEKAAKEANNVVGLELLKKKFEGVKEEKKKE